MKADHFMTPPTPCPSCGRLNDRHTTPAGPPKEGDISICFGCHTPHRYEGGQLRALTAAEAERVQRDPRVKEALAALREGGGWGDTLEAIARGKELS